MGEGDLWNISRDNRVWHPTQKPVALAQRAIKNSSQEGVTVLDLFSGSGSTLLAAEIEGRSCCAMEIDPRYCQIIIDRWEKLNGQKAKKV